MLQVTRRKLVRDQRGCTINRPTVSRLASHPCHTYRTADVTHILPSVVLIERFGHSPRSYLKLPLTWLIASESQGGSLLHNGTSHHRHAALSQMFLYHYKGSENGSLSQRLCHIGSKR